jgi:hypothetical protein
MPKFEAAAAVHSLNPPVTVRIDGTMPALSPELEAEVEAEWIAACVRMAPVMRLFNGRVFNAVRITPTRITGHLTEYRRVVAQMARPALFDALQVRSLAVCGLLTCSDGVVFGRRQPGAAYQAELWQLPPAGSVDSGCVRADGTVDLTRQLLTELTEEVGLSEDEVRVGIPLCVVEHEGSRVSDLGIRLHTDLTAAEIVHRHATNGNAEYSPIRVVAQAELGAFLDSQHGRIVPSAPILLHAAGLLA